MGSSATELLCDRRRSVLGCLIDNAAGPVVSPTEARSPGGNFYELRQWSDADWMAARERIEAQNAKDKTQR